jgi:tRNA(Ile)-lysidine synthetase-like protein
MLQFYKFTDILENFNKKYNIENLNQDFSNLKFNDDKYCISLSGGVDSMVLLHLLYTYKKEVVAVHINYNNRAESKLEEEFLKLYCEKRNISFNCYSINFTRGSINRSDYESITKKLKFDFYKKILNENNLDSILLAHHKDDIIENIFTNFCKAEHFLNLSVIKHSNYIMEVNIIRPLLNYYKQDIYNYAHYYSVPYFKDTTPNWSIRGKFRNNLLPLLFDTFNGFKTNLLSIAKESEEWGNIIESEIINKYFNLIEFTENELNTNEKIIILPIQNYKHYPLCFWQIIFSKIFHKYNQNAPSRKSLELFIDLLKNYKIEDTNKKIILKHNNHLQIINNKIFLKIII